MRFIDEAKIKIAAGHGGPGCVSFRREKFIPRGGPNGGDGGKGGDIIIRANVQLGTLQDFRFKRSYQADSGSHGSGTNKAGRDGEDREIQVPVGTTIRNAETGEVLCEMTHDGQVWVACAGGRGGKGNAHFVSSTFQAPKFAQPGEAGEFLEITLQLRLLADAAIIGYPNAGKSTLISVVSAARPKIADYAFTTMTPNLGVVTANDEHHFVLADIPGLIEGAHRGLGLGHKFLKHIEKTQVLVHLLDGTQILEDATKPDLYGKWDAVVDRVIERYQGIRTELGLYNPELLDKPEIVVVNKCDVLESEPDLLATLRLRLAAGLEDLRDQPVLAGEPFLISAATQKGTAELVQVIWDQIQEQRRVESGTDELEAAALPDAESMRR